MADLTSTIALLIAAVLWPAGSLMLQRSPPKSTSVVVAAYQQFFGGIGVLAAMALAPSPGPSHSSAWIGWAYLVIAGSVISFTSYVIAVRTLLSQCDDLCVCESSDRRVAGRACWTSESPPAPCWDGSHSCSVAGVFRHRSGTIELRVVFRPSARAVR